MSRIVRVETGRYDYPVSLPVDPGFGASLDVEAVALLHMVATR